jgi:hypothetical protein
VSRDNTLTSSQHNLPSKFVSRRCRTSFTSSAEIVRCSPEVCRDQYDHFLELQHVDEAGLIRFLAFEGHCGTSVSLIVVQKDLFDGLYSFVFMRE